MEIILPGKPIPQPRPRFFTRGSKKCFYDPAKKSKRSDKKKVYYQAAEQGCTSPMAGSLSVQILFEFKASKKLDIAKHRPKKPDIDNLAKYYLDVMNKIIYNDDSQVCCILCQKVYSHQDKTTINVSKINGNI